MLSIAVMCKLLIRTLFLQVSRHCSLLLLHLKPLPGVVVQAPSLRTPRFIGQPEVDPVSTNEDWKAALVLVKMVTIALLLLKKRC